MGNYAGVDWAADKHDVRVADETGEVLLAATFAHDEKGLRALCRQLVRLKVALVAIERPDGLLVERLLDAGLRILALHPNQVAATRDRFRVSGGKSDGFDAFVLCELARTEIASETARLTALRDRLLEGLKKKLDLIVLNGSMEHRLPGNLNVSFAYVEGEALMMAIKDVAVSSGSACTSASLEPSYVLRAMGVSADLAHSSIRFGLGRFTTEEEIDFVIRLVVEKVRRLRDMSPLYEMVKEGVDLSRIEWANPH